jgi:hypothetical protein
MLALRLCIDFALSFQFQLPRKGASRWISTCVDFVGLKDASVYVTTVTIGLTVQWSASYPNPDGENVPHKF